MINTGFSEINESRLNSTNLDPWFVEVAITGDCNFSCSYCNRFTANLDVPAFEDWLKSLPKKVRHIQITGGEPTVHPRFMDILKLCRDNAEVVGLSTNGSQPIKFYLDLPVDMFSISLDDYDYRVLTHRGYQDPEHIEALVTILASEKRKVVVGMVIDELNFLRAERIIDYLIDLGVSDVRLSISTKAYDLMPKFSHDYPDYPTLNYRVQNFNKALPMRGFPAKTCGIMLNDYCIVGGKHYPCLVYFREKGKEIGQVGPSMLQERFDWMTKTDCTKDPICAKYCMDFKCDFNTELERKNFCQ